ncbi:MAG: serine hydrolase domain-containing protein [Pseudomonadota bacterium]
MNTEDSNLNVKRYMRALAGSLLWFRCILGSRCIVGFTGILCFMGSLGATSSLAIAQSSGGAAPLIDSVKLEAFVDGVVMAALDDNKIPGATVSVVDRKGLLLLKGYGIANADTGEAVDPEKHLFRIASITKTFTALAIMQLQEQGKLSLNTNIREYLGGLEIDDQLGMITIADLLTHSAGFEDRVFGYYGPPGPDEGPSMEEQLAAMAANQVREPGEITAYSNYGYALLGRIIAQVSGISYADYIRQYILIPLGMESSDIRVKTTERPAEMPWLAALQSREAKSHYWRNGWFDVLDYPPSRSAEQADASMSATAADMARYMRMLLNAGTLPGSGSTSVRVINSDTWQTMRQPLFTNGPTTTANAHGFWADSLQGHAVLNHGGSIDSFKSMLVVLPDLGLGIFISTNSDSGSALRSLPGRIMKQFLAVDAQALPEPAEDFGKRAERYTGTYISTRRNEKRLDKLVTGLISIANVSATDDGYLVVERNGEARRYVETSPDTFTALKDGGVVQFRGDDAGEAYWLLPERGLYAYERPRFFEQSYTLLVPWGATLLLALVAMGLAMWRLWKPVNMPKGAQLFYADRVLLAAAAAWLGLSVLLAVIFSAYLESPVAVFAPYPSIGYRVFYALTWLAMGLSLAGAFLLAAAWLRRSAEFAGKPILLTLVALIFLSNMLAFAQWNLNVFN